MKQRGKKVVAIEEIRRELLDNLKEISEDPAEAKYAEKQRKKVEAAQTMRELFLCARSLSWDIPAFLYVVGIENDIMRGPASAALVLRYPDPKWSEKDFENWDT